MVSLRYNTEIQGDITINYCSVCAIHFIEILNFTGISALASHVPTEKVGCHMLLAFIATLNTRVTADIYYSPSNLKTRSS